MNFRSVIIVFCTLIVSISFSYASCSIPDEQFDLWSETYKDQISIQIDGNSVTRIVRIQGPMELEELPFVGATLFRETTEEIQGFSMRTEAYLGDGFPSIVFSMHQDLLPNTYIVLSYSLGHEINACGGIDVRYPLTDR